MRRALFPFVLAACASTAPLGDAVDVAIDAAADTAGCGLGQTPAWDRPGCDLAKAPACFDPADACAGYLTVCDCDGKTVNALCGTLSRPFKARGACPTDATVDASAEVDATVLPDTSVDGDGSACSGGLKVPSWDKPGCDIASPPACFDGEDACAGFWFVCGCDGKSISAPCGLSPKPFKSVGECPK